MSKAEFTPLGMMTRNEKGIPGYETYNGPLECTPQEMPTLYGIRNLVKGILTVNRQFPLLLIEAESSGLNKSKIKKLEKNGWIQVGQVRANDKTGKSIGNRTIILPTAKGRALFQQIQKTEEEYAKQGQDSTGSTSNSERIQSEVPSVDAGN